MYMLDFLFTCLPMIYFEWWKRVLKLFVSLKMKSGTTHEKIYVIQKQKEGTLSLHFRPFSKNFFFHLFSLFVAHETQHRGQSSNIQSKILPQRVSWDKDISRPFSKWRAHVGYFFRGTTRCYRAKIIHNVSRDIVSPDTKKTDATWPKISMVHRLTRHASG